MNNTLKNFLLFYLSFAIGTVFLFGSFFYERFHSNLQAEQRLIETTYHSITQGYQKQASLLFQNFIDTPYVLRLMADATTATQSTQDQLRSKLYAHLIEFHRSLKLFKLKQLHFHLPDNRSFLRFHRPTLFGDDLSRVRGTVNFVNTTHQSIAGFEEGRIFNGYRFVFPLKYKSQYVGSVETSVSMAMVLADLRQQLGSDVEFIIKRSVVGDKVFKEEQSNYRVTPFSREFMYENSLTPVTKSSTLIEHLLPKSKQQLQQYTLSGRVISFTQMHHYEQYLLTFLPIKNPVSNDTVAYLVFADKNKYFVNSLLHFTLAVSLSLLVGGIFFNLFYRVRLNQQRLKKTQKTIQHHVRLLKETQEIAHLGTWEHDVVRQKIYWSDELYRILGRNKVATNLIQNSESRFEPEESSGTNLNAYPLPYRALEKFLEAVHPEDRKRVKNAHMAAIQFAEPYHLQHRFIQDSGTLRYVELEGHPETDSEGNVVRIVGTVLDITQRVEHEKEVNQLKEQYRSLVEHIPDVVFRRKAEINETLLFINSAVKHLTGYDHEDFLNRIVTLQELIHPSDRAYVNQTYSQAIEQRTPYLLEYRIHCKNGTERHLQEHGSFIEENGDASCVIQGILSDITVQKTAHLRLRQFIDTQRDPVLVTDGKTIDFANKAFYEFFEIDSLHLFNERFTSLTQLFIPHDDYFDSAQVNPQDPSWIHSFLKRPGHQQLVQMYNPQGQPITFRIAVNTFDDDEFILSLNDISDTMAEQQHWKFRASHDPLTGVYNRAFFDRNASTIVQGFLRQQKCAGILFFDIDHFKSINDRFGHSVGDAVLKKATELIKQNIRESDYLIRWGGEEFVLLCPTQHPEGLDSLAEHLREIIEHAEFPEVNRITASFGGTCLQSEETIENALERADDALYYIKGHGRNGVRIQ